MKNFVFIVVLMLVLKPVFPVVEYIINYDYIAKVLCENKAKPVLKCNGKCHLMKQLAKESESEKPISSSKKMTQEVEVLFCQTTSFETDFSYYYEPNFNEINPNYFNFYSFLDVNKIFHPPTIFYNSIV
jgi:hypothetical protein